MDSLRNPNWNFWSISEKKTPEGTPKRALGGLFKGASREIKHLKKSQKVESFRIPKGAPGQIPPVNR